MSLDTSASTPNIFLTSCESSGGAFKPSSFNGELATGAVFDVGPVLLAGDPEGSGSPRELPTGMGMRPAMVPMEGLGGGLGGGLGDATNCGVTGGPVLLVGPGGGGGTPGSCPAISGVAGPGGGSNNSTRAAINGRVSQCHVKATLYITCRV